MDGDNAPPKRPKRYWYIEKLWRELKPGKPQYDSTVWAKAYAQQEPAVSMQGIPPAKQLQGGAGP